MNGKDYRHNNRSVMSEDSWSTDSSQGEKVGLSAERNLIGQNPASFKSQNLPAQVPEAT